MIVCPNCRNANPEEAEFCNGCGRSLEPVPTMLTGRRDTPGQVSAMEVEPPPPPSRWRVVLVIGAIVGAGLGYLGFQTFRPEPCQDLDFSSDLFGYCVDVPAGWQAGGAQRGETRLDQFAPPGGTSAVLIEAVDLAGGSVTTAGFGQFVREKDQSAGFDPGPVEGTSLDGHEAEMWNTTFTNELGQTFRMTEVVVVRDEIGWRIAFSDAATDFADRRPQFQQLLDSWRFA